MRYNEAIQNLWIGWLTMSEVTAFFQRFQFRLLFFLLLIGSIPLVLAAYVFYGQSASNADEEQARRVELAHKQLLQRTARELDTAKWTLLQISHDYAVQRYTDSANKGEAELKALRDYIQYMLQQQLSQHRYFQQLCITMEDAGRTICTQVSNGQSTQDMAFKQAIIEPTYQTPKGTVTAIISTYQMVQGVAGDSPFLTHRITDSGGEILFQSGTFMHQGSDAAEEVESTVWNDSRIVSILKLDRPEGMWTSTVTVMAEPSAANLKLQGQFVWLFVLLAVIAVASSFFFSRHVTRPLHQLQGLMKRAELGDLKAYWMDQGIVELNELGLSYNQMLNRLEELIKQVKQEEGLKKEAEMESLQHQLNPHFLYNTLNTIKWVAKIHKTPQISEAVSALVRLLQAGLGKRGDFITIRDEVGLIKDYMEIQAFRFGDRITMSYEIEAVAAECLVPRMIFQPLVENAILHGIEPSKRPGGITIRVWTERDLLLCQVEDNGVGMANRAEGELEPAELRSIKGISAVRERFSGIGIEHIRQKIKLYYGPDYKMLIINKPGEGTIVRLSLPIHQSEG
jgi:sensor histidine kinase YesM